MTALPPGNRPALSAATPPSTWRVWLLLLVATLAVLYLLRTVVTPFVAGLVLAYILDPVADWLERRRLPRLGAVIVITVGVVLILVLLFGLLGPVLMAQIQRLVETLPSMVKILQERLMPLLMQINQDLPDTLAKDGNSLKTLQDLTGVNFSDVASWASKLMGQIISGGMIVVNMVALLFITPVVAFYLLRDWDRMLAMIESYLPRHNAATIVGLAREADEILAGFVRGQAAVCLALGTFYAVTLTLVGLEYGILVGLGAGLVSFIPYLGTISGFFAATGLALVQSSDPWWIALVVGVFVLGQMLEGNILTPRLVGNRVRLHPVWVIFAILAGGSLFGFVGVLLAVPVAAVIGVLVRFALRQYRASTLYERPDAGLPEDPPT